MSDEAVPLVVVAVTPETADVKTFTLAPLSGPPLQFAAGQALTLMLDIDGERLFRTFSIASSPLRADAIEMTIKAHPQGRATQYLHERLAPGEIISVRGPLGRFTVEQRLQDRIAFLSAGSGASPLMSMLRYLADSGSEADIAWFHAARTPEDILFARELAELQRRLPGLSVSVSVSRSGPGWFGLRGRISRRLLSVAIPDLGEREVFCCGPAGFMDEARLIHAAEGGRADLFHVEHFGASPVSPTQIRQMDTAPSAAFEVTLGAKCFSATADETLLEAATRQQVVIPCGCASGMCGTCRMRLLSGEVDMRHQGGLSPEEESAGYILACSSRPRSNIAIEF
jgi:ferredoxin-NADP reductase